MIDDFAVSLLGASELALVLAPFGIILLGGLVAWATDRSAKGLLRALYFAIFGLASFAMAEVQHLMVQFLFPSLAGGYFWAVSSMVVLALFLYGFLLARMSAARSRDAFGSGKFALLFFVPLLGFVMFFKRSKGDVALPQLVLRGPLAAEMGVFVGALTLVLASALNNYADKELDRQLAEALQPEQS